MRSHDPLRQVYKRIYSNLLSAKLLPCSCCFLCGENVPNQQLPLCVACLSDLPLIMNPCQCCCSPVYETSSSGLCGQCLQTKPFYHKSIIPLEYTFPSTVFVKQLKYKEKILYSKIISRVLLDKIQQRSETLPECLIPVPLHPSRLLKRGFNQSALITKYLSKELNVTADFHSCRRIRNTPHQTGLSDKQRSKNIRNAFSVSMHFSYKHIAIVDDVVTTGSTVNELARVLQQAGAEIIEVWACARTINNT